MNDISRNLSDETRQLLGKEEQPSRLEDAVPVMETLEIPEQREDAGSRARQALRKRAKQAKHVMHNVYLVVSFFILVFIAGMGGFVWQEYQKPAKFVTDIRPCYYKDPKTDVEITGTREYNYPNKSLFGFEYRQAEQIVKKTKLDVKGSPMSVSGISSKGWWSVFIDQGERGIQLLKPAELYVVTMGSKTYIFHDQDFCR